MTVILLRHGVSTSNTARTLAGRSAGVELTERGREQAQTVADRLSSLPIEHIVCSPLLRCQRTVAPLDDKHGGDVLWVACTHGDVIKSVLADAFGIHLDGFQRIVVEPASLSVVRYTPTAPYVWRVNDTGADLSSLAAISPRSGGESRAAPVPGGETGITGSTDNRVAERPDS
ncbi:histidine phosphatase family protein [Nocardia crassostreae]|uniref:histidine phosphatase family protein n=1 Tax=Nocardia crassostreae TaxID=53428 RepID=UPI00082F69A6|nr:histidine phosphatase family protein [Nocardia crassostreae]